MSILPVDPRIYRRYKVVVCPRCGQIQAVSSTRTFRCRYCGYRDRMERIKILAATDEGRLVPELVRKYSMEAVGGD